MIDLLKFFTKNIELFVENITNSKIIDLVGKFNIITGELMEYPKTANFNSMFIKVTKNQASMKGSIHKYFNMSEGYGEQNFNDFSYCDFKYALNSLQNRFSIYPLDTRITNLEFGINIDVEQDPQELIDNFILMYDFKPPNRNEKFYGQGDYLEFKKTDYSIKIYNKSKQNSLSNRKILRVELKITGARYLKKHFRIFNLMDLDRDRFRELFYKLLEHFDKLLIVDTLALKNNHRIDEMTLFQNGINPNYWKQLNNTKSSKVVNRFKNDFNNILDDYSLLKTKKKIKALLEKKYLELMSCDCDTFEKVA